MAKMASLLMGTGVAVFLILFGGAGAPSFATDHFNLESGIPTTIEDIEPIDQGHAEFQAFGRFEHRREGENDGVTEPRLAFGILEKTQLEIASPLLLGEGEANGNGDIDISALRKLRDDSRENAWPGFALEAELRLPTGAERRSFKNRVDAGLSALLKKEIGNKGFHVKVGIDWTGDESNEEALRRRTWSAAIGHHASLTDQLVLVSDLVWQQADDRDTRDIWMVETGVRAQMAADIIGALGIGAGLNRGPDTPVATMTIGIQVGL